MAIDFRSLLDTGAFTRQQAEALIGLVNAAVAEAVASGGAPVWGDITGTLADQTDLDTTLDGLATSIAGKESAFAKGDLVQGAGVTLTGDLTERLVGTGNITIAAAGAETVAVMSADVSSTTTAVADAPLTALAMTVEAGKRYHFRILLQFVSAVNTTGLRFNLLRTTADNEMLYVLEHGQGATTASLNRSDYFASGTSPGGNVITTAAPSPDLSLVVIEGILNPSSANGTVTPRIASEVAGSSVTIKAGSFIRYREIA